MRKLASLVGLIGLLTLAGGAVPAAAATTSATFAYATVGLTSSPPLTVPDGSETESTNGVVIGLSPTTVGTINLQYCQGGLLCGLPSIFINVTTSSGSFDASAFGSNGLTATGLVTDAFGSFAGLLNQPVQITFPVAPLLPPLLPLSSTMYLNPSAVVGTISVG